MQVLVGICFILACAVAVAVDGAADSTNTDNLSIASKRVSFIRRRRMVIAPLAHDLPALLSGGFQVQVELV
uniref:Secreted protein n=1 Tax=Macrostomum lignano TaxID=282301 RepID=A0A1I8FK52_9PLAT